MPIDAGDQWDTYWASGGMDCYRDDLVVAYTPFAEKVTGKIIQRLNMAYDHEQAMSDAYLALLDCIPRYKLGMDACFETFVGKRIWGTIMDSLRRQDILSRNARDDGFDMVTLDKPILVDESRAFDNVVHDEIMEDLNEVLPFDDQILFYHAFIAEDREQDLCRQFHLTPAALVERLDELRWAAQMVIVEAA